MRHFPLIFTTLLSLLLDLVTKQWWGNNVFIPIWGDTIAIVSSRNTGIAFSIPLEGPFLVLVTVTVILLGAKAAWKHLDMRIWRTQLVIGLILAGALGNLYERIFFGAVTDFVKIGSFPVFNWADSSIFIGVVLLLIQYKTIERKNDNSKD